MTFQEWWSTRDKEIVDVEPKENIARCAWNAALNAAETGQHAPNTGMAAEAAQIAAIETKLSAAINECSWKDVRAVGEELRQLRHA